MRAVKTKEPWKGCAHTSTSGWLKVSALQVKALTTNIPSACLCGAQLTHTHRRKKAGGKPRRPSTFHRRAAHSLQVLGKRSPPRAWLNARILTRSSTELSADPCSSTRTALCPPAVSQLLLPFPGKTRAHSRGQEPGGAAAGRLSPRASGETRTAVPAGLTYLAAAV